MESDDEELFDYEYGSDVEENNQEYPDYEEGEIVPDVENDHKDSTLDRVLSPQTPPRKLVPVQNKSSRKKVVVKKKKDKKYTDKEYKSCKVCDARVDEMVYLEPCHHNMCEVCSSKAHINGLYSLDFMGVGRGV